MNRFIDYVISLSEKLDLILKINYSTHCGWHIQLHKKGCNMPFLKVSNIDKERAFEEAYEQLINKGEKDATFI